ncbi:MAG TPA: PhoH family protein [Bacillota bacterium]|nr:PhoH family protein [Bacillota bacterium]
MGAAEGGQAEARVALDDNQAALQVLGRHDEHLRLIADSFGVRVVARGEELTVAGAEREVEQVAGLFRRLLEIARAGTPISGQELRYAIRLVKEGGDPDLSELLGDIVVVTHRGKPIRPKTLGQREYVEAIRDHSLVFGIGPAGTGKTYLAVALAVAFFRRREINRIILTRPAVEAGERLGFLPGALEDKVHPYLRPIYDALYDVLGQDSFQKLVERGNIEVAPLAYMRGRTLDDSFVLLDEAQNTTPEQMKMLLTRLGLGSRAVVTGDITQVDLPRGRFSGLEEVRTVLAGVKGIEFIYLTERDVVRHELVQKIIKAYEAHEKSAARSEANGR